MHAFEIKPLPSAVYLRLGSELTIEHARSLHAALTAALTPALALEVDLAALTRIDAAALQVLLAAARLASRARLTATSSFWTAALRRHGLADPFVQP